MQERSEIARLRRELSEWKTRATYAESRLDHLRVDRAIEQKMITEESCWEPPDPQ